MMKKSLLLTALAVAIVPLCAQAGNKVPARPEPSFVYFQKDLETMNTTQSVQGTAVWGDFLFSMRNRGICVVTDLKKHELVSEFDLASYGVENHANDAFFGVEYYEKGDLFPLLYVSQCKDKPVEEIGLTGTSGLGRLLFVERVLTDAQGKPCGSELVQVIEYLPKEWNSRVWAFDRHNPKYMYCYGNTIGNAKPGNRIIVQTLRLPEFSRDRFLVRLGPDDVLDTFFFDEAMPEGARGPHENILQGAVVHKGILYLPVGVGRKDAPSELFYVDMRKRDAQGKPYRYGYYDYNDVIPCEMEDVDIWNGESMICTTNSPGRLRPVYSFRLSDFKLRRR